MGTSFADKTFDKMTGPLAKGEYDNCVFKNCDLANANLSESLFIECTFIDTNLSLAQLGKTLFRDVQFQACKMWGLHFEHANPFGLEVRFDSCSLNHSSFFQVKIKKTLFRNTQLHEVDFTECDLSGAVFDLCDLHRAVFDNTLLEKADFRTSFNYSIDPAVNKIKKARFSLAGLPGLLDKYDIEIDP